MELFERVDAVNAAAKIERAKFQALRAESADLLERLHRGLRDLHEAERKSHALLSNSRH
jgi:hypothetical protein